jgi:hypothetical protein
LYIDPHAFASGLRPPSASSSPPAQRATIVLTVEFEALDAAELTLDAVQTAISEWDNVTDVRVSTAGDALVWSAPTPRLPTTEIADYSLGELGTLRAFPSSWQRRPVPTAPALEDLSVTNDTLVRAEVTIAGTHVGALLPGTTGTIHAIRAGTYPVVLITPDGFEHPLEAQSFTPARAPAPSP